MLLEPAKGRCATCSVLGPIQLRGTRADWDNERLSLANGRDRSEPFWTSCFFGTIPAMAVVGLIILIAIYTAVGFAFAANLRHVADRIARFYEAHRGLAWQFGATNPLAYRGGGLVMLAFGAVVLGWIALSSQWRLPVIDRWAAAWLLLAACAVGLFVWACIRLPRR